MADVPVSVQTVAPRMLAAVRREVRMGGVAAVWRPALDQVWEFLRSQPGLRTDGHNIFLYHHPAHRNDPMDVDFGVEVVRGFDPVGEVRSAETPAGQAAIAVHVGPYSRLPQTHAAIHAWCAAQQRSLAGMSWEIYGDWTDDEAKLETSVLYLLA